MAYLPLSTANLPNPAIDPAQDVEPRDYFETFLYTGNGAGLQVGDVIKKPADTIDISSSLIFNQPDTHYLSRTPSASTETNSATTFTVSCWFKPTSHPNDYQTIWMASTGDATVDRIMLRYNSSADDNKLLINNDNGFGMTTTAALKDTGRWYHIVVAVDTRSSVTQSDRVKVWVDGVLQSLTVTTAASADETTKWNQNYPHKIGDSTYYSGRNLDGYLAEFHNIDGTAYTADDFGTFDANGIWIPKTPSVTYGDNGFHLNFSDNTSTTTLGEDQAGSNDWTLNGFVDTSNQVSDSPTDNFATLDGSLPDATYNIDQLSEGNLSYNVSQGNNGTGRPTGSLTVKSGKWYWEVQMPSAQNSRAVGFCRADKVNQEAVTLHGSGFTATNSVVGVNLQDLTVDQVNSTGTHTEHQNSISSISNNDWIGVAVDLDAGTFRFYKQGIAWSNEYELQDLQLWQKYGMRPTATAATYQAFIYNFGQRSFAHTPPTGYLALSENNITVDDQNLESPDFVWIKNRDNADNHHIYDSVRGVQKAMYPDPASTLQEQDAPRGLLNFNTNGFTVGDDGAVNRASQDYVAWCWKAPTSFSNSAGANGADIASSGKVSTESGFSICTYTATGTAGTVKHGLTQAPDMLIFMRRDGDGTDHLVYHSALGATKNLRFNNADLENTNTFFDDTEPTSSLFSVNSALATTSGRSFVVYCFAGKEGFSKFGSYTGGSDPFVYLGFEPAMVIFKRTTGTTTHWAIRDNTRKTDNPNRNTLYPSKADVEYTGTAHDIDFLSNGFKIRNGDGLFDASATYIYAAWAKTPFKYGTGV